MYRVPEEESSYRPQCKEGDFCGKDTINGILSTRTDYSTRTTTSRPPTMTNCASQDDLVFVNFMRVASQYNISSTINDRVTVTPQSGKLRANMSQSRIDQLLDTVQQELQQEFKPDLSTSRLLDLSTSFAYNPPVYTEVMRLNNELEKYKKVVSNLMTGLKDVGKTYFQFAQFSNIPLLEGNSPMQRVRSLIHHEFGLGETLDLESCSQELSLLESSIQAYVRSVSTQYPPHRTRTDHLRPSEPSESFVDVHSLLSPSPSSQYFLQKDKETQQNELHPEQSHSNNTTDQRIINTRNLLNTEQEREISACGEGMMLPQTFCFTADSVLKELGVGETEKANRSVTEGAKEEKPGLVSQYFKKKQNCTLSYSGTGGSLPKCGYRSIDIENSPPTPQKYRSSSNNLHLEGTNEKDWSLLHNELLQKIDTAIVDCRKAYAAPTTKAPSPSSSNPSPHTFSRNTKETDYLSFGHTQQD